MRPNVDIFILLSDNFWMELRDDPKKRGFFVDWILAQFLFF